MTDYFTRFAEAYSLPDIESTTVADKLLTEFICRYGLPLQIHTDQGAQFTSSIFTEMCKRLHISKTRNIVHATPKVQVLLKDLTEQ